jgi:AcrR family transcriptional regulator
MDKRVVKTRNAVFNALLELSSEKQPDRISVIELCERAGINKSTFYLHYKSIDDCYKKCFDTFTQGVLRLGEKISYTDAAYNPEKIVDAILDEVESKIEFLTRYKNSVVYDASIRKLKERLVEVICRENHLNIEQNYHEVAKVTFLVGGCFDAVTQLLPNYNRSELKILMINVIKRK